MIFTHFFAHTLKSGAQLHFVAEQKGVKSAKMTYTILDFFKRGLSPIQLYNLDAMQPLHV